MEKIDLILLTACCHFENLLKMAENISDMQNKFTNINIRWLICIDAYNGKGDLSSIYEELFKTNINWIAYNSGKSNQENYGGDMYNEPLFNVLEKEYKDEDPWIYILDDDNLLCERMFINLEELYNSSGKRIVWMHYMRFVGDIIKVNPNECFQTCDVGLGYWVYRFNPDPSAILFKASIFKQNEGFLGKGDYDFTSVRVMCEKYVNEIYFDNLVDERYTTYHNGNYMYLKPHIITNLLKGKSISGNFILQRNDNTEGENIGSTNGIYMSNIISIPILSREKIEKIIKIIQEE